MTSFMANDVNLGLWKLLKSQQIIILANHTLR
jgi:hypothetical protein